MGIGFKYENSLSPFLKNQFHLVNHFLSIYLTSMYYIAYINILTSMYNLM